MINDTISIISHMTIPAYLARCYCKPVSLIKTNTHRTYSCSPHTYSRLV